MAYFHPALRRQDGKGIPATESTENVDNKTFADRPNGYVCY